MGTFINPFKTGLTIKHEAHENVFLQYIDTAYLTLY